MMFVLAALLLSGCAIKEHMQQRNAARDDATCQGYGALPGTEAYMNCRIQLDASRRAAAAAYMGGVIQNRPKVCNQVGSTTVCN